MIHRAFQDLVIMALSITCASCKQKFAFHSPQRRNQAEDFRRRFQFRRRLSAHREEAEFQNLRIAKQAPVEQLDAIGRFPSPDFMAQTGSIEQWTTEMMQTGPPEKCLS